MASENPITDADFAQLLELEKDQDPAHGWELQKETDLSRVWVRKVADEPVNLCKGYHDYPGIKKDVLVKILTDVELRGKVDPLYKRFEVAKDFGDYRLIYAEMNMPVFGMSNRDFLSYSAKKTTEKEVILFNKTATDADWPEISGIVRGELTVSGRIIREKEGDPNSSTMTSLLQPDYKGYLPTFAINAKQVDGTIKGQAWLRDFYQKTYKKTLDENETAE